MARSMAGAVLAVTFVLTAGAAGVAGQSAVARSKNVLFTMPPGWTRVERDGVTLLMPPPLPGGKWFELRLPRGEESADSPEQAVRRQVSLIEQRYRVLDATAIKRSRHERGWAAASVALTVDVAPAGQADLRFWVIYAARPAGRIEIVHYVANDHDVYLAQGPAVERFLLGTNYCNLVVLEDGSPKLTELLVNETADFLEWMLDVPFTDGQRDSIRAGMIEDWKRKDQKSIDGALGIVRLQRQLASVDAAAAEFARARTQQAFVDGLRADPSALAAMLVRAYDAGRTPIAPGEPPLTRQAADAMLESIYFMAGALETDAPVRPTDAEREQWAAALSAQYARLSGAQRNGIAQMPTVWAALRWAWPTLPPGQREELKTRFAAFEPVRQLRSSIAAARKAKDESLAAAVERMQRSHESFLLLSNVSHTMHNANMAMIANIGGSGWRYEYRR